MQKELSKRVKELAVVGECLIPLQLIWFVLFWHSSSMTPVLIFKAIIIAVSFGMVIGCNKEKEFGIKCAHILFWIELIVSATILILWILQSIIYIFGIANMIFCVALYTDLMKIEKIKKEIRGEINERS